MVYYIDDAAAIIYIVDFWDTRREPNAQASQVKWQIHLYKYKQNLDAYGLR